MFFSISVRNWVLVCLLAFHGTQVWEGKSSEEKSKDGTNGELKSHKSADGSSFLGKEATPAVQANGDVKLSENGSVAKSGDVPKGAKPISEKIVLNGVATCC